VGSKAQTGHSALQASITTVWAHYRHIQEWEERGGRKVGWGRGEKERKCKKAKVK